VTVAVSRSGIYYLNGQKIARAAFGKALRKRVASDPRTVIVVSRGTAANPHSLAVLMKIIAHVTVPGRNPVAVHVAAA
jgi:biopolymer transport protein ExbD